MSGDAGRSLLRLVSYSVARMSNGQAVPAYVSAFHAAASL